MKKFFASFPHWTFSVVWFIIDLWLMLAPTKFMEKISDRVKDIDGLCHVILGGMMVLAILFDWQRTHGYKYIKVSRMILLTSIGFVISAILEFLQLNIPEEYRRWFAWDDVICQAIGAVIVAIIYSFAQKMWVTRHGEKYE